MQPNLQTEFQIITNQQGNTGIRPKGNSLKENIGLMGEDECFLGMLNKIERMPDENTINLAKLYEKSQRDDNMLGVVVKIEQQTGSVIDDLTLTEENIAELLLGAEKVEKGKEGDIRLWGYSGNTKTEAGSVEKNTMVVTSKIESDLGGKKSALSEMLNISVKTEENEPKTVQGEHNKNNSGVQISKGSAEVIGKEAGVQIAKESIGVVGKEAEVHISKESKGNVGKEAEAQLLKVLGSDIAKTINNSETKSSRADVQINHATDIKDAEKTAVTDRIVMEGKTVQPGVEEPKTYNSLHMFNEELKNSELSKKDLLLKIVPDVKEKEQEADRSKGENTSDEKASPQDKEFINLKEAGLKIKASVTESSAGKMIQLESESKDSGIIPSKNISGDKSLEEMMPGRENRLASNISRAGTLDQIVEKAALNLKNGKSQVRIDLKPEFLGSVRMKITTENHLVTVRILTEFPVVKEMIENNISQLKTDLQSHGLEIDRLDVSVADDSQQRGKGFEKADFLSEKENKDVQKNKADTLEESEKASPLKESTAENGLDFFA